MATLAEPLPSSLRPTPRISDGEMAMLFQFSIDEYHRMIETGVLTEDDNVELLDGFVVKKVSKNPPHEGTLHRLNCLLQGVLPAVWQARIQMSITLDISEPEPDAAIVRGTVRTFDSRHPTAGDFGVIIEVSDTTLDTDREVKSSRYARNSIPEYWIVNISEMQIEVYTSPQAAAAKPHYSVRIDYRVGESVPLVLDGQTVAAIPTADVLP